MDVSDIYVKMCDCPEIQEEWGKIRKRDNWDCSDFVFDKSGIRYSQTFCLGGESGFEEFLKDFIWLPRQDQIQEMVGCKPGNHVSLMNKFMEFEYYHSLEQKWLAFYMLKKHSKFWGKDGWVNE